MGYKLKAENGNVVYLLLAGKHFVRNKMTVEAADLIIKKGKLKNSNIEGFPINVDDRWFFKGEITTVKKGGKKEKNK